MQDTQRVAPVEISYLVPVLAPVVVSDASESRPLQVVRPRSQALLGCALLAGLFAGWLAGCSSAPSDSDCDKLRDKLVDLEFAAMGAKAATSEARAQIAKQKQDTSEGVSQRFKEACTKKTPKSLIDCALGATSLDAVKQCDESK
jgi:hypothetical protein